MLGTDQPPDFTGQFGRIEQQEPDLPPEFACSLPTDDANWALELPPSDPELAIRRQAGQSGHAPSWRCIRIAVPVQVLRSIPLGFDSGGPGFGRQQRGAADFAAGCPFVVGNKTPTRAAAASSP